MNLKDIPIDLTEFLFWFRKQTEQIWSDYPTSTFEDYQKSGIGGRDWVTGTKWLLGFTNEQIDSLEQKWQLQFPEDYRQFLQILGAPDRLMLGVWWAKDGYYMFREDVPSFYNWQTDDEAIKERLARPLEGLLFDVENNGLWLDSWGNCPEEMEVRRQVLTELVKQAPPLIPIIGHHYLVGRPLNAGNLVLSVHQSDIIIYGSNLRNFLILEFSGFWDIDNQEAYEFLTKEGYSQGVDDIPFWGEVMNYSWYGRINSSED